jgi:hypothetical protein
MRFIPGTMGVLFLAGVTAAPSWAVNPERDAHYGETHVHTSW